MTRAAPARGRCRPRTDRNKAADSFRPRGLHGIFGMPRPVLERPVVEEHRMSEEARGEEHRGRLLPDVAVADDGVARLDACLVEERLQSGVRLQRVVVVGDLIVRNVLRALDVAAAVLLAVLAADAAAV